MAYILLKIFISLNAPNKNTQFACDLFFVNQVGMTECEMFLSKRINRDVDEDEVPLMEKTIDDCVGVLLSYFSLFDKSSTRISQQFWSMQI